MRVSAARSAPHPFDVAVGTRVRQVREAKGISQDQLAHALSLTFQQVQHYERGTNQISCSKLSEIAAALDAPMRELLGEAISREAARAWTDLSLTRRVA